MRRLIPVVLLLGWFGPGLSFGFSEEPPSLLERLSDDIADNVLHDFSRLEAAFILSGVEDQERLRFYLDWFEGLMAEIRRIPFDPLDRVGNAAKVFNYLHTQWLKAYQLEATTLLDVVEHKRFNCVSATLLFNLVCEALGWETEAFETPSHVYSLFRNFNETVMVENTTPLGFQIVQNLQAYSRYIAHYYPESEAARIGLDRIYLYEQRNGRRIDNTELLGLLAYNRAYLDRKRGDYAAAYRWVLLAQDFNRDSRSNVQFELGLYQEWGKRLFDEGRYEEAFSVLADGVWRYPDDGLLKQNARAAFFRAIQALRKRGDWPGSKALIEAMRPLKILKTEDKELLGRFLGEWREHLRRSGSQEGAKEAELLRERLGLGRE